MKIIPLFEAKSKFDALCAKLRSLAEKADKEDPNGDAPLTEFFIDLPKAFGIRDKVVDEWLNSGADATQLLAYSIRNSNKDEEAVVKAIIKIAKGHEHSEHLTDITGFVL